MSRYFGSRAWRTVCLLAAASAFLSVGCNRSYYRKQADYEASKLVAEKSCDPRWDLPDFTIEMDPRSRYYDPYDRDRPPMPPDDPASHELMRCVDGKKGFKYWQLGGSITDLENPYWREWLPQYVEMNPDGSIRLRLEDAVRLALINSPDYQQQLETIYLSALDVSTERFRFDVQFFGANETSVEHFGRLRGLGGETNAVTNATEFQATRRFSTAGELLVGFANSFVWQFAGPDSNATLSLLNFALMQPLLRNGGRAIALEQLTIAERGLLANLRAMRRYQQGFYTGIAVGDSNVSQPQRRGGFFGGTGLTGFTGQGEGGFGGVGQATGFGRGGAGGAGGGTGGTVGFAGGGAGTVGGFLGQLQQLRQIQNTEISVAAQQQTLDLLEAHLAAGLIDLAQVDQFRQNIESEQATLLQNRNAYLNALEGFIISDLGLPPNLPVELDDTMLRPFELLSPRLIELESQTSDLLSRVGELPANPDVQEIREAIAGISLTYQALEEQVVTAANDLTRMDTEAPTRLKAMNESERALYREDRQRLDDSLARLKDTAYGLQQKLDKISQNLKPETADESVNSILALSADSLSLIGELELLQARARLESISIDPIALDSGDAVSIARVNRLDWMNNRAALVDTWRLIEFNANALEADMDIILEGDVRTVGDNPLDFRAPTGNVRASIRIDAPLTRRIERNNFRQQLIDYQRARRQQIQFEDSIMFSLRSILRDLDQLAINLEIQRRAVIIAIRRVDQTREVLNQPSPPSLPGEPPTGFGPTAATNLLTALSDLRNSQNNFLSVWLNYYASRMLLYRELGIMQLDQNGLWIDEPLDVALLCHPGVISLPPQLEIQWAPYESAPEMDPSGVPPLPAPAAANGPDLMAPPVEPNY